MPAASFGRISRLGKRCVSDPMAGPNVPFNTRLIMEVSGKTILCDLKSHAHAQILDAPDSVLAGHRVSSSDDLQACTGNVIIHYADNLP